MQRTNEPTPIVPLARPLGYERHEVVRGSLWQYFLRVLAISGLVLGSFSLADSGLRGWKAAEPLAVGRPVAGNRAIRIAAHFGRIGCSSIVTAGAALLLFGKPIGRHLLFVGAVGWLAHGTGRALFLAGGWRIFTDGGGFNGSTDFIVRHLQAMMKIIGGEYFSIICILVLWRPRRWEHQTTMS